MIGVGKRIKDLRLSFNLTQLQVSEYLQIDRSNYSKYEKDKLEPNNEMLVKLANLFDVTTDYLLGRSVI